MTKRNDEPTVKPKTIKPRNPDTKDGSPCTVDPIVKPYGTSKTPFSGEPIVKPNVATHGSGGGEPIVKP